MRLKIAVVVVTFNRLDKLKKALAAYEAQSRPVDILTIVDNFSSDGTRDYLRAWEKEKGVCARHVVYLNENMGGSGGFHDGCADSLKYDPDWIFVADDDAYPDKDAFNFFESFIEKNSTDNISAICSSVLNMDGHVALHHRCNYELTNLCKIRIHYSTEEDYKKTEFSITTFSYVGTFLKVSTLRKVGLCNRDFFIYYDDTEHSMRMHKEGQIVCVPLIKVYHDDAAAVVQKNGNDNARLWRLFYGYRNEIYSLLQHYPLAGFRTALSILVATQINRSISKKEKKMYRIAIWDALRGKLGKHQVYKP